MNVNLRLARTWLYGSAATGLALIVGGANIAYAQTTPPATTEEAEEDQQATLDTITVTGIRGGLENSINLKRLEDGIVEAVTAEDIGKLPDVSIAESLARLPGLAVQRIDGRGQQLSIRGLGPDFTTALLNGREQVTVGDNRGVEFDQYPSELLSGVVVYKTPEASLLGQGLMGTVDLRTLRPLSQDGRVFAVGARYEQNDKGALNAGSDDTGYRLNALYADQFANDTIGVAIGVATMSTPTQSERFNAWGYPNAGPNGALLIGGSKPYVQTNELERTGVIGTFEYEPSTAFKLTVDAFVSDFEEEQILRGIELPLAWSSASLVNPTVENGFVTRGTFNGVKGVIRNDVNLRTAELLSLGARADFDIANGWRGVVDLSHSSADRTDVVLETYAGTGYGPNGATDNLGFRMQDGGPVVFSPTLNYGDYNTIFLTSPQGWGTDAGAGRPFGQAGYYNAPTTEDTLSALRFEANKAINLGPFSDVSVGINFSNREKSKDAFERFLVLRNGAETLPIPAGLRLAPTNLAYLGLGPMVSYDPLAMLNAGVYDLRPNEVQDVIFKRWSIEEDVATLFGQLDIDSNIGTIPVRGNVGLQFVRTEQSSTGTQFIGGQIRNGTFSKEFDEWLPSLALSFDVLDNTKLRFAAARTLARARMDQLAANQNFGQTNGGQRDQLWQGGGGNPDLEPYVANGVDLSLEHYFAGSGILSAAVFYKDLDTWIRNEERPFDFGPFLTEQQRSAAQSPRGTVGFLNGPQNLNGGYIQGLELAASIPGDVLSPALSGFGVFASGTWLESEIKPVSGPPIAIEGLSDQIINVQVFYERDGFQARLSQRYRDDFLGEVTGFGAGRETRDIEAETVVDGQIGYTFQGGSFEGLSVLFQANNITDEPFVAYLNGDTRQVREHQSYGRTFLFGVSWKR